MVRHVYVSMYVFIKYDAHIISILRFGTVIEWLNKCEYKIGAVGEADIYQWS